MKACVANPVQSWKKYRHFARLQIRFVSWRASSDLRLVHCYESHSVWTLHDPLDCFVEKGPVGKLCLVVHLTLHPTWLEEPVRRKDYGKLSFPLQRSWYHLCFFGTQLGRSCWRYQKVTRIHPCLWSHLLVYFSRSLPSTIKPASLWFCPLVHCFWFQARLSVLLVPQENRL